jgi:hypothetical protein
MTEPPAARPSCLARDWSGPYRCRTHRGRSAVLVTKAYCIGQLLWLLQRYDGVAVSDLDQPSIGQLVGEPAAMVRWHHLILWRPDHYGRLVEEGELGRPIAAAVQGHTEAVAAQILADLLIADERFEPVA